MLEYSPKMSLSYVVYNENTQVESATRAEAEKSTKFNPKSRGVRSKDQDWPVVWRCVVMGKLWCMPLAMLSVLYTGKRVCDAP